MDMTTVIVTIASIVTGKVCVLIGLSMRLRWRTRHEQVQRQHLTSVAQSVGDTGDLEVVEHRPNGHTLRIKITRGPGGTTAA